MSLNNKAVNNSLKSIITLRPKKIPEFINLAKRQLSGIKDAEVKKVFQNLYEKVFTYPKSDFVKLLGDLQILAQKVDMVENPDIKKELLTTLQNLVVKDKKGFKQAYKSQIQYVEDLSDAVNIINDKYQNIHTEPRELYKNFKDTNCWILDLLEGKKGTADSYRNGDIFDEKVKLSYKEYEKLFEDNRDLNFAETYKNNLKYESLRKFYDKYGLEKTRIADILYKTEYLKTVNPELKPVLEDILSDYGTTVITSNAATTKEDAEYIKEELRIWLNKGGYEAILPGLIDVNILDKKLLTEAADGIAYPSGKILLSDLLAQDTYKNGSTLRHEMTHINDTIYEDCPRNKIESAFIQLKWKLLKFMHKKQWLENMERAGIARKTQEYALTERAELKAVASEARDYNSYSRSFVKDLVARFKMQYWILKLPQNPVREKRLTEDFYKASKIKK